MLTPEARKALEEGIALSRSLRGTGTYADIRDGFKRLGAPYDVLIVSTNRLGRTVRAPASGTWVDLLHRAPFLITVLDQERTELLQRIAELEAALAASSSSSTLDRSAACPPHP